MHGKIWFYTYPSEKMENLTLDDCTFYGKTNGAIQVTDFNTINQGDNYIFYSKEEQPKAQAGEYTRIPLGRFDKGLNVGFVYRGTDRPQSVSYTHLDVYKRQAQVIVLGFTICQKDAKTG